VKTYCKPAQVDVESLEFIAPAVHRCFTGKLSKKEFRDLLISTGKITREELLEERRQNVCWKTTAAIDAVATRAVERIRARDLQLEPVHQFRRKDGNSGKVRDLCKESAWQQIFEHIAVYALMPLFNAKLLSCQCGSIPGRGQIGGKRRIERLLRRKLKKTIAAAKCDVRKAYPSTKVTVVLALLGRDIGKNKPLLWLVGAIMDNYPGGVLLIGGYMSCWLFNYVMSYVLRHLLGQAKFRRAKRLRMVEGIVNYADDFVVFGQPSNLERAIKVTTRWALETLGLTVKPEWQIYHLASFRAEKAQKQERKSGSLKRTPGVDMVGFVVRRTYTIVRGRTFVRFRRQIIRAGRELAALGYVPWWRAEKVIAAWGWIKYTNCKKFCERYDLYKIFRASKESAAWRARRRNENAERMLCCAAD